MFLDERPGIGVREDHRIARALHRRHRRLETAVRAVHDHSDTVHLIDRTAPEIGKAGVLVMAAGASQIVAVIGDQHVAHAEVIVTLDQVDPASQRVHALDVEGDGHLAVGPRPVDVGDRGDNSAARRLDRQAVVYRGQCLERLIRWLGVIGDIDGEVVHACLMPGGEEWAQGRIGQQLKAGVIVPDQALAIECGGIHRVGPRPVIRTRITLETAAKSFVQGDCPTHAENWTVRTRRSSLSSPLAPGDEEQGPLFNPLDGESANGPSHCTDQA
jgi:hypothetical protein